MNVKYRYNALLDNRVRQKHEPPDFVFYFDFAEYKKDLEVDASLLESEIRQDFIKLQEKEALADCKIKYLAESDSALRDFIYLDLLGLGEKSTTTKQEYKMENLGDKLSNIESVLTDHRKYLDHIANIAKEQKAVQEKITALENEAEKIKLQIKERDKAGRFIPKYDEMFWNIGGKFTGAGGRFEGVVGHLYKGSAGNHLIIDIGNCYRTEAEALAAIARQKAIVRVNDAIDRANDGWAWSGLKCNYFFISMGALEIHASLTSNIDFQSVLLKIKSKYAAELIIKNHQDDLKLIFGIKE